MKPVEVTETKVLQVYKTLYGKEDFRCEKTRYKKGDYVRISREKKKFEKSYTWNWSEEIYQVEKVVRHSLPVYHLVDLDHRPIEGSFYETELQRVKKPEAFKIERILQSKRERGRLKHLVRWRGYTDASDSWIFDSDIEK